MLSIAFINTKCYPRLGPEVGHFRSCFLLSVFFFLCEEIGGFFLMVQEAEIWHSSVCKGRDF